MERIQKALEKARDQREQIATGKELHGQPEQKKEKEEAGDDIHYSHTRVVPVSEKTMRENRIVAGIPEHPQGDIFRVLRTKVLHKMREGGLKSLAVVSPTKGCGKSMVAANLAVSISLEMNHTVLLVDLDLRRPSISKYFGFKPEKGIADYLLDGAELQDLLVHPSIERLVILPVGRSLPQSSELLSTNRMTNLVEGITNRYASRIIIFDLPPLLHMDDALTLLPQVHASLLVVEEDGSSPDEIKQSLRLLEGSNLLGTVYNKARQAKLSPY